MLLGYNTNGLQNHRLDDALHLLADEGYEAVALTLDTGHLDPLRCTAHEVDAIAALLDRLNLHVVIETGARFVLDSKRKHEPTLMTTDAVARRRRLDFYERCASIGADLGATVVSFWAGIDRQPGPDSRGRLRDGVRAACEAIRQHEMIPSLEPEPGMAIATVGAWRRLRDELGAEAPRLTLDIGHLFVEWEGEPLAVLESCASEALHVHLEDMRKGVHEHLLPGEGEVDFAAVLRALAQFGYGGPVCFELSRHSHMAPTAVSKCREVWQAGR